MVLPIRLYGDPVLRRAARRVTRFDDALERLANDMIDTMIDADGAGLAAPQVGASLRMFVVAGPRPTADDGHDEDEDEGPSPVAQRAAALVLINPTFVHTDGRQDAVEGCLSLPGLYHEGVPRHAALRVRFQDVRGAWHELDAEGRFAVVLQHELDHLDGVLYLDRLAPDERVAFMDEHRAELARMQRDAKAALKGFATTDARASTP